MYKTDFTPLYILGGIAVVLIAVLLLVAINPGNIDGNVGKGTPTPNIQYVPIIIPMYPMNPPQEAPTDG